MKFSLENVANSAKRATQIGVIVGAAVLAPIKQAYSDLILSSHVYDGSTEVSVVNPNKTYKLGLELNTTQEPATQIKHIVYQNYPSSDGAHTQTSGITVTAANRPASNDLLEGAIVSADPQLTRIDTNFNHTNFIDITSGFPSNRDRLFVLYDLSFGSSLVGTAQTFYESGVTVVDTNNGEFTLANENFQINPATVQVQGAPVIPEPATGLLAAIGTAVLSVFGFKRRKAMK